MFHRQYRLFCVFLFLLLTVAVSSCPLLAQPDPPKPHPQVQALLDKGKAALAASPSRSEEALRLYNEALETSRTLKDRVGEASVLLDIGQLYNNTSQLQKALEFYEQALPIYRQAGDKVGEARALMNVGIVTKDIGQPQKALELYEQALSLFRKSGYKMGEARVLNNIGLVYQGTGQPQKALEFYQQALPLFRQVGDRVNEARALNNIGLAYRASGQPQKVLEFYQQALSMFRQLGEKMSEARVLNNIGVVYKDIGQPQKALEFYDRTLPIYRQVGDKMGEAGALANIGNVYSVLGQRKKSLEFFQQALSLDRQSGYKIGEAGTLTNIGLVYSETGQPQKALEFYQQALPIYRQVRSKMGQADTLTNIGIVYSDLGQPQKALEFYEQALPLFRQVGSKAGEADTLNNIGIVYRNIGQPQKALELYQQALPLYRQVGEKVGQASTLASLALVHEQGGRLALAERHLKDATALLERVRDELGGLSQAKVSFLTSKLATYHRYIHVLLKQGKAADAFAVVQKTKARALLDLMASGKVDIGKEMTEVEKQQEQALRLRADQLNAQMVKEGVQNEVGAKKRFAALKTQLTQAESDLQTFTDSLYARHPDLARKRGARTATLADIARFLPKDTALLEYVVLKAGTTSKDPIDRTVLFVVTNKATEAGKGAAVRTYILPLSSAALTKKTDALRLACANPRKPYRARAREMYRLLLPPEAARQLAGKKRLLVCPDGPLWDVPFAALHDGRRFLLERYEIAYAYSATGAQAALLAKTEKKQQRRSRPSGTLLALANPEFGGEKRFGDSPGVPGQRPLDAPSRPLDAPSRPLDAPSRPLDAPSRPLDAPSRPLDAPSRPLDAPSRPLDAPSRGLEVLLPRGGRIVELPGTQREADALKRRFAGAAVYTKKEAQERVVKEKASGYRYLHLASHAFFNDGAPLLSSVVLANPPPGSEDDGFLTAREIFDLDLSATDLVVLSACNTARGEKRNGEGVIGLTWALFVAGAPTQVLSQWAVDDASTATLMERFYAKLSQPQAGKGEALRAAALSLRRDRKHAHPYYWAPFILVGDWRR